MEKNKALQIIAENRKSYNMIAEDFDIARQEAWPEFELLKPYIAKDMRILDWGCGNGRLYKYLYQVSGIKYQGIDNSEKLVEIAKKNYPKVDFCVSDIFHLPFKNGEFDVVAAIASFHHIPSEELRLVALREIYRVLKPGGVVFMTNWNLWQRDLIKKYKLRIWDFFFPRNEMDAGDFWIPFKGKDKTMPRYYHHFGREELARLCRKAGFEIISDAGGKNRVTIIKK
jgi:SAM-dependent methyltransferase